MSGPLKKSLTPRQHNAIRALLKSSTLEAAANEAGVGTSTLRRWLRDEAFAAEYRAARERLVEETIAGLQRIGTQAVEVLRGALEAKDMSTRVRAARYVLDFLFKASEIAELRREMEEIKAFDREHFGSGRWMR